MKYMGPGVIAALVTAIYFASGQTEFITIVMFCVLVTYAIVSSSQIGTLSNKIRDIELDTGARVIETEERLGNRIIEVEARLNEAIVVAQEKLEERDEQAEVRFDRRILVLSDYLDTKALNHKDGKYLEEKIKELDEKIRLVATATSSEIEDLTMKVGTELHELAVIIANKSFGDEDEEGEGVG